MHTQTPREHDEAFRHPSGSWIEASQIGLIAHIPDSAGVVLDEALSRLWRAADGRTRSELESVFPQSGPTLDSELLALRAAGLLLPPIQVAFAVGDHNLLPDFCPIVSTVIVTRDGRHYLQECLSSLMAQTYPRIEIIVVDDQSEDGTGEFLRNSFPMVKVIQQRGGPNFAAGCNLGIKHAAGELIFLLNNDTVLDRGCVQELVAAQAGRTDVAGVAAMLRFSDNRPFINGIGSFVPSRGHGHDVAIGSLDVGQFDHVDETPLLCFGAALLARSALEKVGPLDERYEFYYEDADWSYRARSLGLRVIAAPRARVYHKFGASTGRLPSVFKTRLVTRNRLRFVIKNMPPTPMIQHLTSYAWDDAVASIRYLLIRQVGLASAIARGWGEFICGMPRLFAERRRVRRECAPQLVNLPVLMQPFPPPEMQSIYPRLTQKTVESRYRPYLVRSMAAKSSSNRVLIISPDVVDVNMGGVGMRYWELAGVLAKLAEVTLAVPGQTGLISTNFAIQPYTLGTASKLEPLANAADIVLLSGAAIYHHPFLRNIVKYCVIDLYDPTVLENLERHSARRVDEQNGLHGTEVAITNELLRLGDFFICATEKQRDYWLGALTSLGRVNPSTYAADPTLRRLIDVVPFGLPDKPPRRTAHVLKGVHPGIGEDDKVILWGGGLWDWLDPLTAIESMPLVLKQIPQARLFFMGTRHPNPAVPASRIAQRAIDRAVELNLNGNAVFFHEWVPYSLRSGYLLDADVGISLHGDHIETRFSVRTRLMDYLWANLPMVLSGGDALSELLAAEGLARLVVSGDVNGLAKELIESLQTPLDRSRFDRVAERFRWSRVAEPLVRYVDSPWLNAVPTRTAWQPPAGKPVWQLPRRAVSILVQRGPVGLAHAIRSYLTWHSRY